MTFVKALNANNVDLMVASCHASKYNWQLHYPTAPPESYFPPPLVANSAAAMPAGTYKKYTYET